MIRGAFLCDGTSDNALATVAIRLAASLGIGLDLEVVDFSFKKPGLALEPRLRALPQWVGSPEVLFIHRDSEKATRDERAAEIKSAVSSVGLVFPFVSVVPVRMTEAWLLCDADEIRRVSGKPKGTMQLLIPGKNAERDPNPKATLRALILEASGLTGRKREALDRRFASIRRQLLETLDVAGPVTHLESFQQFREELSVCLPPIERGNSAF